MMFPTFQVNLPSTNDKTNDDRGYNHDEFDCHSRDHCLLDSSLKEQKEMNIKVNDDNNGVGRKATTRMSRGKKANVDKNCSRKGVVCDICGKTFFNSVYLHQRYMHKELFSTHCSICGKDKKTTSNLKAHMLSHSDEKPHQCFVCGKMFKWGRSLDRHTKSAHSESTPYKCSICGKGYKRSDHLKVHERSHDRRKRKLSPFMKGADNNLYHCKVCDKTFQLKSRLVWHMAHHSDEKPFQCTLCDKAYKWRSCLQKHQILHKDETPYECSLCPKKFKIKHRLKSHQLTHIKFGRFTCEVCGKRFKWLRSLQKHQDLHKEEKLFDCSICTQKFKRREDLKVHEQVHSSREEMMEGGLHEQEKM